MKKLRGESRFTMKIQLVKWRSGGGWVDALNMCIVVSLMSHKPVGKV